MSRNVTYFAVIQSVDQPTVKLGPQDLPHLSNRHNYSDSCEQHGQMDDYRSGVYENLANHFTTNPVTNMDKPIITVATNSPLTTPVPPNKHYVISQQCMNSDYNLSSEPMVIIQKIDAPTQTTLPDIVDLDCLSSTSIPSTLLCRLDGHRNNNNNNGNSSTDSPDTHHPLWHTFSPANIFYRLGLHQVLSLSPAPPTSREPPLFPLSHSPPTPTSIPSSSSLPNINAENQNSLINQPVLVSQSSCINMDTISAYCECMFSIVLYCV
ncbi:unnamed protein product [Schistosoma mattheei]|uniref:Uncharacterized protein n=1 Tax=Schistosoma mattheei TaxID=31246 RepID=A0A183PGT8_9TREM|nr:unnamed protein product [Schistosoma mattheei]